MSAVHYAGIMTGTSLDAVNVALCRAEGDAFELADSAALDIPPALAEEFRALSAEEEKGGALTRAQDAAAELSRLCAEAFLSLSPPPVEAVGCHGQTVLHRPERGWSLQLLNGALLAHLTGANVVCDFRSRAIAEGGEGAPLAPLFHRHFFAAHAPCAIVNLGGIANITLLTNGDASGWDIGPANMLLDGWHRRHCGGSFDKNGEWAAGGKVSPPLLKKLRAHPFLQLPPPKSCGREQFDLRFFESPLSECSPQDAQATLLEWSALEIAAAVAAANVPRLFLCGGGARNLALTKRIAALSPSETALSDKAGIPAEHVESAGFAWLAQQFMQKTVLTHSPKSPPAILGALYPA